MWFGIHPLGAWIAFLVLQFAAPLKVCASCGERVKIVANFCPRCAAPFGREQIRQPQVQTPTPRRRGKIAALVAAILLGLAGLIGFFLFIFFTVTASFMNSAVFQEAMERCRSDKRVIDLLGLPITEGRIPSGSMSTVGDASGTADLSVRISGPKGKAILYVNGTLKAGKWSYQVLEVEPSNGSPRINLLAAPAINSD
jgi:hypothetical protein